MLAASYRESRFPDQGDNNKEGSPIRRNGMFLMDHNNEGLIPQHVESINSASLNSPKKNDNPFSQKSSPLNNYASAVSAFGWANNKGDASMMNSDNQPHDAERGKFFRPQQGMPSFQKDNGCGESNPFLFNAGGIESPFKGSDYKGDEKSLKGSTISGMSTRSIQELYQAKVRGYFTTFIIICTTSGILLISLILGVIMGISCRKDSPICAPKIQVSTYQLVDPYFSILKSIIIKLNDVLFKNKGNQISSDSAIGTLEGKLYSLSYTGFCKLDPITDSRICYTFDYSMDLLSVIMKDVGIQLSIGESYDIEGSSNEFIKLYHSVVDYTSSSSANGYNAHLVKTIGKYMPYLFYTHLSLLLLPLLLSEVTLFFLSKPTKKNEALISRCVLFMVIVSGTATLISGIDAAITFIYIEMLDDKMFDLTAATVTEGLGLHLHYVSFGCQLLVLICFIVLMFMRPWIIKETSLKTLYRKGNLAFS